MTQNQTPLDTSNKEVSDFSSNNICKECGYDRTIPIGKVIGLPIKGKSKIELNENGILLVYHKENCELVAGENIK
jgi:hypothetical protein